MQKHTRVLLFSYLKNLIHKIKYSLHMTKKTQPPHTDDRHRVVADAHLHDHYYTNGDIASMKDAHGHFTEFSSERTPSVGVDEVPTLEKYQHDPNSRGYY